MANGVRDVEVVRRLGRGRPADYERGGCLSPCQGEWAGGRVVRDEGAARFRGGVGPALNDLRYGRVGEAGQAVGEEGFALVGEGEAVVGTEACLGLGGLFACDGGRLLPPLLVLSVSTSTCEERQGVMSIASLLHDCQSINGHRCAVKHRPTLQAASRFDQSTHLKNWNTRRRKPHCRFVRKPFLFPFHVSYRRLPP